MKYFKLINTFLFALLFAVALSVFYGAAALFAVPVLVAFSYLPFSRGVLNSAFITQNNINEREVFGNAVNALGNAFFDTPGFNPSNYKLTQSYLRLEQAIQAGITQYRFPILVNEQNPTLFNTEKRLNLQDSFVVSSVGIFLGAPTSPTAANFLPMTYPNPLTFTTTTAADANTLYAGSLEVKVNNNVLIPDWDIWRHYNRPGTQAVAVPPAAADETSGIDGFYPMEPNIVFVGAKNTKLTINLPAGIATIIANSRIVMIFRGILAQNTTVVA